MNSDLSAEEEERAAHLVGDFYAGQLLKAVREASEAQRRAMRVVERLEYFNTTEGLLDQGSDALDIAVWSGSRAIRSTAQEIRGDGGREATDRSYEDRMLLLRWLQARGYDVGPVYAEELEKYEREQEARS
jgi:hypothetical protein